MSYAEQIAQLLIQASPATTDMIYLPNVNIGEIIAAAMQADSEIKRLNRRIEDLKTKVENLNG